MLKAIVFSLLLATAPSSASYTLKAYELGGGAGSGSSTNYNLRGNAGGLNGKLTSATYGLPAGIQASSDAAVPAAPTLVCQNGSYDRLHLTINITGEPTDAKYLIAISSDGFATTKYVQLDNTIGTGAGIANYQTYAAWGGASGFDIVGLAYSTTYTVKISALQGVRTASAFGPTTAASTSAPSVTFSLQTSQTSTPPFSVAFTSLIPGAVTSGSATVISAVTTNAANGGSLVISDTSSGLTSSSQSFTLASASADLSVASSGYGAQVSGVSQTSGGPIAAASPFNASGNNVGSLGTTPQAFANWSNPITAGSATVSLLAKSSAITPPATDYADVITISLSLLF